MDIIIIISLLVLAAVVVAVVGMYLIFGGFLPQVFAVLAASRDEDLVDADAEILPREERHSSEVLKETGNEVKTFMPLPITQELSQPPQAAPQVVPVVNMQAPPVPAVVPAVNIEPAPMQAPPAPPIADAPLARPVAKAPQELVQRAPILDVQNPIAQPPPPQPIDVQIPEAEAYNQAENKSRFGVRYSSNPSGRVLRDRRRRRNAE